ncbi:hypothetical protein G9A89_023910 [Geosiphon pyriformis]|nr:hypothetical protein G9A89_023910 [Geosiphon pyriformis]
MAITLATRLTTALFVGLPKTPRVSVNKLLCVNIQKQNYTVLTLFQREHLKVFLIQKPILKHDLRLYTAEQPRPIESETKNPQGQSSPNALAVPSNSIQPSKSPKKLKASRGMAKTDNMSPGFKLFIKGLSILLMGSSIGGIVYSGRPFDNDRENQYKDLKPLNAWLQRFGARSKDFSQFFTEPPSDKLLPDKELLPNYPALTLVINLDETLIYSTWDREHGWRTAKRPGVDYFLAYMSSLFEEVIFTSQPQYIAEQVVNKLDPLQLVPFKLFREATRYVEGKHVKDLSKLNRDLSKVIVMDSNPEAYALQPDNAIAVPPWKGDSSDTFLIDIIPFLEHIYLNFYLADMKDVRPILTQYQGKPIPEAYAKWEKECKEQSRVRWEETKQSKKGLASWLGGGLGSQMQEQYTPHQQFELTRQDLRREFMENYKKLKEQAPELQKLLKQEQEFFEKQLKESKTTIWQLITQGPPPLPTQGLPPELQAHSQAYNQYERNRSV